MIEFTFIKKKKKCINPFYTLHKYQQHQIKMPLHFTNFHLVSWNLCTANWKQIHPCLSSFTYTDDEETNILKVIWQISYCRHKQNKQKRKIKERAGINLCFCSSLCCSVYTLFSTNSPNLIQGTNKHQKVYTLIQKYYISTTYINYLYFVRHG